MTDYRCLSPHFDIYDLGTSLAPGGFAEDVCRGLNSSPKELPPRHFYDSLGSILFDAITHVPEYYLTRAESEILATYSRDLVARLPSPVRLIELGSGSSTKTKYLIEALLERQEELHYLPIDVSESAVERSSRELLTAFPALSITGFVSDYHRALEHLATESRSPEGTHSLILFLGSSIGNLDGPGAHNLLRDVRRALEPGESFLLGADLKKGEKELLAAYEDTMGITRAFNLNLLVRINRELGGEFDLTTFEHEARYNADHGRIESYLESRVAQAVAIRDLSMEVSFHEGETIHTESSHKYDLGELADFAAATGFHLEQSWFDSAGQFSENLLVADQPEP